MQGDFSLNPLTYRDRVSRVLFQMGRVQLDSDINEQTEVTLRSLRSLCSDVIGAHGGIGDSFQILVKGDDLLVRYGTYYVDGIRCTHLPEAITTLWDVVARLSDSPNHKLGDGTLLRNLGDPYWQEKNRPTPQQPQILYLDVWERHVSSSEDDSIREVALLGPDTASRAVIVWQIRTAPAEPVQALAKKYADLAKNLDADPLYVGLNVFLRSGVLMRARAKATQDTDPCIIAPDARYRGAENRLYRVEIHDPGDADKKKPPMFKWSADNASIVYPVRSVEGSTFKVDSLGRDDRTAISIGDWVEVSDDEMVLTREPHPLLQVIAVDRGRQLVTVKGEPPEDFGEYSRHPILRRWATPPVPLKERKDDSDTRWYELSDGVEVQFTSTPEPLARYRPGDYWLIPTRTATGDILWPGAPDHAQDVPPHGVDHHYAPLAIWTSRESAASAPTGEPLEDLRYRFESQAFKVGT